MKIDVNSFIDIPGYPDYKIKIATNEIMSLKFNKERLMHTYQIGHGYIRTAIYDNGKQKGFLFHRLVMLIKEGPCPEGMEVCHNDGNPKNNHPDNLRYDTRSNNILDTIKHGTHNTKGKFGSDSFLSKKVAQYSSNMQLLNTWGSVIECSIDLNFSKQGISRCARRERKYYNGYIFLYI